MSTWLTILLQIVFWLSVLALLHSYVIYPLLMKSLACRRKPNDEVYSGENRPEEWPYVVVAMAVHNEAAVLERTLSSIFESDYPSERFEVLIAADNCSDRSVEIISQFRDRHSNLQFREFEGRNGKIRVLNETLGEHRARLTRYGDWVLISCDANVRWSKQLPWKLAQHFRNPKIGQVATNVRDDRTDHHDGIADEEEAYVNRENEIKYHEGLVWGRMMGAFGACFAMRGRLFQPVPETFCSDDFCHTMRCYELGYDAIVEPGAIAWEDVSEDIWEEFRRKSRIAVGNWLNYQRFWRFLLPWRCGPAAAFAFWSHKGIRWIGPFLLFTAFFANVFLTDLHWIYSLALAGQIALLAGATADSWFAGSGVHVKILRALRYFYLMNLALLLGTFRFFSGNHYNTWTPTRRVAGDGETDEAGSEDASSKAVTPEMIAR